jgi:2-polyprenyl-3-methyl-5-hydroxy-6-metoxy-1,4-benzoquinol methylase
MINEMYSPMSVTGYDWYKKNIEIAKIDSPLPNYVQFDILKDDIKKNFDIVICTQVLEHLVNPEKAINNLFRMTRKGGFICISVPDGRKDTSCVHINFWSPESFRFFIERYIPRADSKYGILNEHNVVILKKE